MTIRDPLNVRVAKALKNDERTKDAKLEIVSEQGIVTVSGYVDSNNERDAVHEIVAQQEGVIKVINETLIKGEDELEPTVVNVQPPVHRN
jgi:osmotically-inducible protein OsmY